MVIEVKTTSDRETSCSENDRREAFREFIKRLPRLCSPTICGTVNYKSPKSSIESLDELKPEFNWSIDQIALLNPCEFSYHEDFQNEMINIADTTLDKENDTFFKQNEILPSPDTAVLDSVFDDSIQRRINTISEESESFMSLPNTPPSTKSRKSSFSSTSLTPFNYSRLKQKKKLFNDDETCGEKDVTIQSRCNQSETIDVSMDSGKCVSSQDTLDLAKAMSFLSPIVPQNQNDNVIDVSMINEAETERDKSGMDYSISLTPVQRKPLYSSLSHTHPRHQHQPHKALQEVTVDSGCQDFTSFAGLTSTPSHF